MTVEPLEPESRVVGSTDGPELDAGPLGLLPRISSRQARLEARLARVAPGRQLPSGLGWLQDYLGPEVIAGPPEILWRPSGLGRPGMVAQFAWPRLATRLGLGLETPVAHAVVDRLLGYTRLDAESRLQLTPVEWGVLTFAVARTLETLGETPGPLGPWDLTIDRVGPDPFDAKDLGGIVTIRWPLRLGAVAGSARLWISESLVARWLSAEALSTARLAPERQARLGELNSLWRAEAGTIAMPRGLGRLRVGGVLPLIDSRLRGSPQSPSGPIALVLDESVTGSRYLFPAEPAPLSGGGRVSLTGPLNRTLITREAIPVNLSTEPNPNPGAGAIPPTDVPVTLTIELGRVNLPLSRLADLKAGDVLELGRHSREPVELTSGGRLVARGELVQIDTELGVRVTTVFL